METLCVSLTERSLRLAVNQRILKDKANFIMSMLELVVGGSGLTAEEKSVIDRCLPKIYEKYFENSISENMPILQDLYDMLKNQEEKVGKKLATEMELTTGRMWISTSSSFVLTSRNWAVSLKKSECL